MAETMRIHHVGGLEPLPGSGFAVFNATVMVNDPDIPYDLGLAISVVHGKPVCTELRAVRRPGGMPVTRRGLNSIPVDRLVREAAAAVTVRVTNIDPVKIEFEELDSESRALAAAGFSRPRSGRRADPAAHDKLIADVVERYRRLVNELKITRPKPAIARDLGISQSYVSSLLAEARRRGLLGPSLGPGRAGEAVSGDDGPQS